MSVAAKIEADEDAVLVERLRQGEAAAFNEIVERHREKLQGLACMYIRDRHEAEEIVQDAFVRLHRNIQRFRGDCSLATYLHRITINLARNRYWFLHRRARHRTFSMDQPISEESGETLGAFFAAADAHPAREQAVAELQNLVDTCMTQLEPEYRQILTLRNVLNRSYGEIAAALGIEEGTVKSRISRARKGLRRLMAASCPDFGEAARPGDWLELRPEAAGCAQKTA